MIRSTWDYHLQPAEWFRWLDTVSAASRLIDEVGLVRWNSDKRYLLDWPYPACGSSRPSW